MNFEEIELFVLDMDGTFYLGDRLLEGANEFLDSVEEAGKRYIFFTNNSSKSPQDYIEKLSNMNRHIDRGQIMTSGDVTIQYLNTEQIGKSVYLVGTSALEQSFLEGGIRLFDANNVVMNDGQDVPDIVVIGFDLSLTYEKLERACTYIRKGALFLATHLDINCPTEEGFIPDCGAMCAAISLSTGVQPKYLGKPFLEPVNMVVARTGVTKEHIAFVGDRIYTDVATGVKNGAHGVLVLSGETKLNDVFTSDIKPDAIYPSLKEMPVN